MDIILIRHGRTQSNTEGKYMGSTDEALCENGAAEIAELAGSYPKVEYIFASPMKRTRQTKKIIYGDAEEELLDDLRECSFGDFEGKTYEQLKDIPEYQNWIDKHGQIPNGEDFGHFCNRTQTAFFDAVEKSIKQNYKSVAFVIHGGVIMAIMDKFSGDNKAYFDFQVKNGGGYMLTLDEKYWQEYHTAKSYKEVKTK